MDQANPDAKRGLYDKFKVIRMDQNGESPGDKHDGCDYFVLDMTHDPHALPAIIAYGKSCNETHPFLSLALSTKVMEMFERFQPDTEITEVRESHKEVMAAKDRLEQATAELASNHDPDWYECDGCAHMFQGEPEFTVPPNRDSPDGLTKGYCLKCGPS